jgi:hypothetical protein
MLFPKVPKPVRPHLSIGYAVKHPTDGLLFFEGGRELRIVAYDVSRTDAVCMQMDKLLPIHFYITFDDFLTSENAGSHGGVGTILVSFERWLDIPPSMSNSTKHAELSPANGQNASPRL